MVGCGGSYEHSQGRAAGGIAGKMRRSSGWVRTVFNCLVNLERAPEFCVNFLFEFFSNFNFFFVFFVEMECFLSR